MNQTLLLFSAGIVGGVVNAVAGGATLITFPVMLMSGLPPVLANATNAIAIAPGHWLAALADRNKMPPLDRQLIGSLGIAFCAAIVGAGLLLALPGETFMLPVPALIGFATVLFAAAPVLGRWSIQRRVSVAGKGALLALILSSLYGGFFGAGLGILLSAVIAFSEPHDIRKVKVLKNLIAGSVSLAAVTVFIVKDAVNWVAAMPMLIGALLGGYAGGHLNRWLPGWAVRAVVIGTGVFMTFFYASRYWF
nr:sulfite exporter TauE/SafE family protein [uncultured Pseudomonas sp.]